MIGNIIGGAFGLLDSVINRQWQQEANEKNAALQKEFAQNSLQWKVADAKKAGIHPLAALGASGYSASPSFVGGDTGGAFGQMGKGFGQVVTRFVEDEMEAKNEKSQLEIKRMELENQKLAKEISSLGQDPYGGILENPKVPSLIQPYTTPAGNIILGYNNGIQDQFSENQLRDYLQSANTIREVEYEANRANAPLHASGAPYRYVPASIDEMVAVGMPMLKKVTRTEWENWVKSRGNKMKEEVRFEKIRRARHKKWGHPDTNTSVLRNRAVPTHFDFSYTPRK